MSGMCVLRDSAGRCLQYPSVPSEPQPTPVAEGEAKPRTPQDTVESRANGPKPQRQAGHAGKSAATSASGQKSSAGSVRSGQGSTTVQRKPVSSSAKPAPKAHVSSAARPPVDTLVHGKDAGPQALSCGSMPSPRTPGAPCATASHLMHEVRAMQPDMEDSGGAELVKNKLRDEALHKALKAAGMTSAGLLTLPLESVEFLYEVMKAIHHAKINGDRSVLRHAMAEGAATVLTEMCYPGSIPRHAVQDALERLRTAKRLGNSQGDPAEAFEAGARMMYERLKNCSPEEIQALKQAVIREMPGYRAQLEGPGARPEMFRRALMEYMNRDLAPGH